MKQKRESAVETAHAEYAAFWKTAKWIDRVPEKSEDAVFVYEISISHPKRRAAFVVYVGWAMHSETIYKKCEDVTPMENIASIRCVEINVGDMHANIRKAALIAGMCKSEFDYACVHGKKAIALPKLCGSRLQRLTFSTDVP